MAVEGSPLDIDSVQELGELSGGEEAEGAVGAREVALLTIRSLTVVLVLVGGVALTTKIARRGRGSWKEAALVSAIQLLWQILAWYRLHIDQHWVYSLTSGTVDSENTRKVFYFMENLFHGLAVYSGLVVVGRLAGIVGTLIWILLGMSILAPVIFAVVILLLDLTLNSTERFSASTLMGVATGRVILLTLVPLGLLVSWLLGQCRTLPGCCRPTKSRRELASSLVVFALVLFHTVCLGQWSVYMVTKNTTDFDLLEQLVEVDVGLVEVSFFLACIALPWAWLLAMLIPIKSASHEELAVNLKLAKQNKTRNVVKAKKPSSLSMSQPVATPPTSPQKFSPEVTSSPSVTSQLSASQLSSVLTSPDALPPPVVVQGDGKKVNKRRSYLEAMSSTSIDKLEDAPARHSKSADPLWLPSAKPIDI